MRVRIIRGLGADGWFFATSSSLIESLSSSRAKTPGGSDHSTTGALDFSGALNLLDNNGDHQSPVQNACRRGFFSADRQSIKDRIVCGLVTP